jgi:hypothetical protein
MVEVEKVEENETLTSFNVVIEKIAIKFTRILTKRCNANTLKMKRNELWDVKTHWQIVEEAHAIANADEEVEMFESNND